MNTIMVTEKDFNEKIVGYKGDRYFENFIFNDFRIILKHDGVKIIYKIHIDKNINEVTYRMINNGYKDCKMKFIENEDGWKFIENPSGEIINTFIEKMINTYGDSMTNEAILNEIMRWVNAEVNFIVTLKQYIMNESYKRTTIQKEGRKSERSVSGHKTNGGNRKTVVRFLLGDIVEYVNSNSREFKITCECWNVRGHFRHYKNGKVIWIAEYKKGKNRNSDNYVIDHVYNI